MSSKQRVKKRELFFWNPISCVGEPIYRPTHEIFFNPMTTTFESSVPNEFFFNSMTITLESPAAHEIFHSHDNPIGIARSTKFFHSDDNPIGIVRSARNFFNPITITLESPAPHKIFSFHNIHIRTTIFIYDNLIIFKNPPHHHIAPQPTPNNPSPPRQSAPQ